MAVVLTVRPRASSHEDQQNSGFQGNIRFLQPPKRRPAQMDMRRLAGPSLRALLLFVCLIEAGCSVGITVSNAPESIESCGRKIGGC
jgi:hypothetical protein